jgi:hypothetical protein
MSEAHWYLFGMILIPIILSGIGYVIVCGWPLEKGDR